MARKRLVDLATRRIPSESWGGDSITLTLWWDSKADSCIVTALNGTRILRVPTDTRADAIEFFFHPLSRPVKDWIGEWEEMVEEGK